ncbi:hypothetical protein GZ989_003835 [Campylobacter fetus]|uniref:hypothetical protein n=1 Tax=Campylobacter fetus TaxID=196 RepID=UPI0003D93512|nr:hypothetical protein [Campylobacter fetus]OCS21891.1 hypothetical protein CFVI97532_07215 [Campylobacter fetus subsp. venerealis cfvi97/532]OCS43097.1 hypothetical protein CFVI02298_01240 [Campylobacter fetus subsp. venerealis cfvi02/298]AHE94387.1 hypothetical protein CFVI03293_1082 [Campylobacter fetus subsp. venerealis cfvi03/293]EAI3887230.1 hypothetical protein [Campylobacter fetus]KAA3684569.1 hypothetical protein E3U40_06255 [Campylobacter fetus subsp. venerealis]
MATIEVDVDLYDYMDIDDVICYLEENDISVDSRKRLLETLNLTGVKISEDLIRDHCFEMSEAEAMEYIKWISHYHVISNVA